MQRRHFLAASLLGGAALPQTTKPWDAQRVGANCFNRIVTTEWMDAASAAGIRLVRLAFDKWADRDYLLGSADSYQELTPAHLKHLLRVLDGFAARGIAVIPVPLTLPGARWRQNNGGRWDGRLWTDRSYWAQSRRFWRDLAVALRGHPAIAAYNLLNEPAPELAHGKTSFWTGSYPAWHRQVRGSAGDLNAFHQELVEGIRSVDSSVPLVLETGLYATPWAIEITEPLPDPYVIYSVHMYEPYGYTTWRKHNGSLRYPGPITIEDTGKSITMEAAWLHAFLKPVRQWLAAHALPPRRILIGEFGCGRRCSGSGLYLKDLIRHFDEQGWHWLFYSFREDTWDGMDYELGSASPPARYWSSATNGSLHTRYPEIYATRVNNPVWESLKQRLASSVADPV